ncbi:MAG: hypothetical protein IMY87_06745 [Chloroflexi bacterium]|nr:hypothetical protein [Chloroflexota bacterium]
MKTIEVPREFTRKILDVLKRRYSRKFSRVWHNEAGLVGLFIHEEYVFRTSSYQTISVVVERPPDSKKCSITVVASGGGGGIFNINWGSQSAAEITLTNLIRHLVSRGLKPQSESNAIYDKIHSDSDDF